MYSSLSVYAASASIVSISRTFIVVEFGASIFAISLHGLGTVKEFQFRRASMSGKRLRIVHPGLNPGKMPGSVLRMYDMPQPGAVPVDLPEAETQGIGLLLIYCYLIPSHK